MKIRKAVIGLTLLLLSSQAWASPANDAGSLSFSSTNTDTVAVPPALLANPANLAKGNWFWALSDDPVLQDGASAAVRDAVNPMTVYLGGPGHILISRDAGKTWKTALSLMQTGANAFQNKTGDPTQDTRRADTLREYLRDQLEQQYESGFVDTLLDDITDEELLSAHDITDIDALQNAKIGMDVEYLREYLRDQLEQQYDSEFVDALLDDITDDELHSAQDVTDLEALQDLELEMDPDLTKVPFEGSAENLIVLSDYASFIFRYRALTAAGAEPQNAVDIAANCNTVWNIVSHYNGTTYAVTPGAIYDSRDQGASWKITILPPENEKILALDVSRDGSTLIIGMTDGIIVSDDAGISWRRADTGISGAAYEVRTGTNSWWSLTTEGMFKSTDRGMSWTQIPTGIPYDEYMKNVYPGAGDSIMLLSNNALYFSGDNKAWNAISTGYPDEIIQNVTVDDDSLLTFIIQTDAHILEYNNGWLNQSKGVNFTETGRVIRLQNPENPALMITPSGIWVAHDAQIIENSDAYKQLEQIWEAEPTFEAVMQAALDAHYLGDNLDHPWKLRSRLAWLLPKLTGDYLYYQRRIDRISSTQERATYISTSKYEYRRETYSYWQIMALWDLRIEQAFKKDFDAMKIENMRQSRYKLSKLILKTLNKRRALQISHMLKKIKNKKTSTKTELNYLVSMQEIEATLHYLTGGYYLPALHHQLDNLK